MRKTIINLMPLLDVLMISIFWFIMNSNQVIQTTEAKANESIAQLQEELKNVQQENEELKLLREEKSYLFVQLSSQNILITSGSQSVVSISLTENDTAAAKRRLSQAVQEQCLNQKEDCSLMVFVLYDGQKVYYRDYMLIQDVLTDLKYNGSIQYQNINMAE